MEYSAKVVPVPTFDIVMMEVWIKGSVVGFGSSGLDHFGWHAVGPVTESVRSVSLGPTVWIVTNRLAVMP
jgi:hypothetical protein